MVKNLEGLENNFLDDFFVHYFMSEAKCQLSVNINMNYYAPLFIYLSHEDDKIL